MSTPDPTPTPLPAAPDWRALLEEMTQSLSLLDKPPHDLLARAQAFLAATTDRTRLVISLATPPVPPPEPRGCPTPGACSCPTAPIVPPELIRVLELAEAALSDIGDADREPGDDIAWAERRAAQDLPRIRHALRTWRDHATPPAAPTPEAAAAMGALATPPAATREAGPQAGAEISTEEWYALKEQLWDQFETVGHQGERFMWFASFDAALDKARAVLARRGGAAVPSKVAPTEEDLYDLAEAFNGDPVPAIRRALELWGGAAVPVPVSERLPGPEDCDAEGRCWLCGKVEGDWRLISVVNPGVPHLKYCFSHWLPHWALPVPAAAAGEVQP